MAKRYARTEAPIAAQMFAIAAAEYMKRYGATAEDFAQVALVNCVHSQHSPYSHFRDICTMDQILNPQMIQSPVTKLQCCPTSDGAAATAIVSQAFFNQQPLLKSQAILIRGQCVMTDSPALFDGSAMNLVGYEMVGTAATGALEGS
jgi:sterol carrier protein 2